MFATSYTPSRSLASAYRQVEVDTAVSTADPHRLITMLFDGALAQIARARAAMQAGDVATKGNAIGRAGRII